MKIIYIFSFLSFVSAQFALPTFQAIHNSQNTSPSSADGGPVIANGYMHSLAILENGTVKAWGRSNYGQLGQGNTTTLGNNSNEMGDNLAAVDLGSGRTATAVAAGVYHSVAILDNGTVKAWGYNGYGQLGQGNTTNIGDNSSEMGDNLVAIDLGTGRTATAVAAGLYSTAAILDNGTVKVWGYGASGNLGQGNTNHIGRFSNEMGDNLAAVDLGSGRTATAISASYQNTMVLLDNGTVKVWGEGGYGVNGQGNTNDIGDNSSEMGDNLAAVDLGSGRTAVGIFNGYRHCVALLDNATVKAWGYNGYGQLGQGNTNVIGDNSNEMGDNLAAVDLGSGRTATEITAGIFHTSAVLDNGTVKAWGWNAYGILGQGNTNGIGDNSNEMGDNLIHIDLSSSSDKVLQ